MLKPEHPCRPIQINFVLLSVVVSHGALIDISFDRNPSVLLCNLWKEGEYGVKGVKEMAIVMPDGCRC